MSGSMRKQHPRSASADPEVLREQLRRAIDEEGEEEALHALVDGAVFHLVAALVRGDRPAVDGLVRAARDVAEEVPDLPIEAAHAARYRVAELPRIAEVVARLGPDAAVAARADVAEGAIGRNVLAVLAAEAAGERRFLRAGEVHARGRFAVTVRRVGQVLDELLEAGWLVTVVRNEPGPVRHFALSPVGAERVAALGIRVEAAAGRPANPPERFREYAPLRLDERPAPRRAAKPRRRDLLAAMGGSTRVLSA